MWRNGFYFLYFFLTNFDQYLFCCPEGWVKGSYSCYYPSRENATWNTANAKCREMSSNLAIVNNKAENNFLIGIVKEYAQAYIHNFWLDANDIEREGHFIWQSTRQPLVYKNWNPNEPSGGTEDCLEMLFKEYVDEQHIGQWNDKICSHENHFICEKSIENGGSSQPLDIIG
uniref:C-type lectin domain-containing protein n=1 Tax=Magallana gigas TaxID=29159 RepID=A0A8W8KEL5_MAGGI|nr:perlucin [Crassostrea gigas]|eukprot:XP_011411986.1 PREDICTED: perlucin [Crassostrea gigas]